MTTTTSAARATSPATGVDEAESLSSKSGEESVGFDDVLGIWNTGSTGIAGDVYASAARLVEIETTIAAGIDRIDELAAASRRMGNYAERIGLPTVLFDTDASHRYEIAPVVSDTSGEAPGTLEIVVLEWVDDEVSGHWRLPVPDAARGTYRIEANPDAVELAERMVRAWDAGDTEAAQQVYASDVRVHWFGASPYEGLDEILTSVTGAHSIGNTYRDVATPAALIETGTGQLYVVSVLDVTGNAHPFGSLVISVSEVKGGEIVAWNPFFVKNLLYGSDLFQPRR